MKIISIFASVLVATLAGCSGNSNDGQSNASSDTDITGTGTGEIVLSNNSWASDETTPSGDSSPKISSFTVDHRFGQTFLYWSEVGAASYHVYRHNSPITSDNLGAATLLTGRWGPIDQNTSVNQHGSNETPNNFVIGDLTRPLRDDQGLFVHTVQNNEQGAAYYAVTVVESGVENRDIAVGRNASTESVNESVGTPRPVLTQSVNDGKGRVYTQYMDYAKWNPTLNGYAFNFTVALPDDYRADKAYPLRLELHAYGGTNKFLEVAQYGWQVIQVLPSDPGGNAGTMHTWWYGHSADHNYKTQGSVPRSGIIENFTEQRVIAAVNFVINDSLFNVDRELVHAFGHSMGASGALSLGMRYPSVFAGIYASEPMTNYAADTAFNQEFVQLWGERSANLPIINNGPNNSDIRDYGIGGSQPTQVWNWMNHQEQLRRRRADRFAYLMVDHGKADATIPWLSQGQPMPQVFTDARVGFSAAAVGGQDHTWMAFDSVVKDVFGFSYDDTKAWIYPRSLSFPGIHNASGSGSVQPGPSGDDRHNTTMEWSTPVNNFHQGIVDSSNRYEISLRSMTTSQTADITPRNTNSFRPSSGSQCRWSAISNNDNANIGSGTAAVDGSGLLTIPGVRIVTGNGTRLVIDC